MGPYFFAWCDEDDSEFSAEFARVDEDILDYRVSQEEGDFASLELTIRNPRIGLLAPGRHRWAWFSFTPETTSESETETETLPAPMFFGRVVGLPEDLDAETVQLTFIARSSDFDAQKYALAQTLKAAPYWDPIWFSPETVDDPENVLESRTVLWHIDRVTHDVTVSDIANGEDGTLIFTESNVFADSLSVNYSNTPTRYVNITAQVNWSQEAAGTLDISSQMYFGYDGQIATYTGDGLADAWPKTGDGIGQGWTVSYGDLIRLDGDYTPLWDYGVLGMRYDIMNGFVGLAQQDELEKNIALYVRRMANETWHDVTVPEWWNQKIFVPQLGWPLGKPPHLLHMPLYRFQPVLHVAYSASRSRSEVLTINAEAGVQDIVTDPDGDDTVDLSFSSSEIASPAADGSMPIGNLMKRTYFAQPRGTQSIEYLLCVARARLIMGARAVRISFDIPYRDAIAAGITLRKNAVIYDHRLPGGVAAGKIVSYEFTGNGDTGEFNCNITIGCTVGKGEAVSAENGSPSYIEDDYIEQDYYMRDGMFVMPVAGAIAYQSVEGQLPNDDGWNFERMSVRQAVRAVIKTNSYITQEEAMGTQGPDPQTVLDRLNAVPATFDIRLKSVEGGPFETDFDIVTRRFSIPKTINLEAESSA